jgi:hypothetical protein
MAYVTTSSLLAPRIRSEHNEVQIFPPACVCESVYAFSLSNFSAQDTSSAVIGFGMSGAYYFTKVRDGGPGIQILTGQEIFYSQKCPDQSWGPLSPLINGYREYFP